MFYRSLPAMRACSLLMFLAVLISAPGRARADSNNSASLAKPNAAMSVGATATDSDSGYIGDHSEFIAYPWLAYQKGRFFLYGLSAGYGIATGDHYAFSVLTVPEIWRRSSSQLGGMHDLQFSMDGGANLAVWGPVGSVSFGIFHDLLGRSAGGKVRFAYSAKIPLGGGLISPSIGFVREDSNFANYYYGVNAAEARPGRPAYRPGPAMNPTAQLKYEIPFADRWRLSVALDYMRFGRAIRLSPLVDESRTRSLSISLLYAFGQQPSSEAK